MKKKSTLFSIFLLGTALISFEALTNGSGPPSGSTGSPESNGFTCARSGCHQGGPAVSSQTIAVSHDIPANGFQPNTDYNFTLTATSGAASSNRIGFQLSIESGSGHEGTLSVNGNAELLKSGSFLGHSFNGTQASGGVKSWNFIWNSGSAPDGATVYVACNFSNNNGTNSGDVIATQTFTLSKAPNISLAEKEVEEFHIFPNPANDVLNVQGLSEEVSGIDILSLDGKLIRSLRRISDIKANGEKYEIGDLPAGNYLVVPQGKLYSPRRLAVSR